jgi:hypothetical protein
VSECGNAVFSMGYAMGWMVVGNLVGLFVARIWWSKRDRHG